MGLSPEQARSTIELRRRRDELMAQHHPDRGGEADMAARVNETYARMVKYLGARKARRAPAPETSQADGDEDNVFFAIWKATLHASAAQLSALALIAAAGFATYHRRKK
jgi:hypothetical protein